MWKIYEMYMKKFGVILNEYMPDCGEGDNLAAQTVVAVNRLVRGWFYDGDVYESVCCRIVGANLNDVSCYANWLSANAGDAKYTLAEIVDCDGAWGYAWLLYRLANLLLNEAALKEKTKLPKRGTIYNCQGVYGLYRTFQPKER